MGNSQLDKETKSWNCILDVSSITPKENIANTSMPENHHQSSEIFWPHYSPDLTTDNYFLWR